ETGLRFHKSLAEKFSEKGWFGLYMLEKQGEMIAGLIAFEWSRKLFYYYSGFDPKWARYSVGMVLLSRCIEDGITRGIKEFDFMRGRASYKMKWNIEERPYHHITMARGRTILLKYLIENFSERVKKKWRKRKAS
ncbi:MAG TPA: GNAT family N-acetyltransferase, partial [Nitrospiria bacterium]|nr:GNAT family N-acetyltransferase [Nitrospiria bacterium]